MIDEGGFIMIS